MGVDINFVDLFIYIYLLFTHQAASIHILFIKTVREYHLYIFAYSLKSKRVRYTVLNHDIDVTVGLRAPFQITKTKGSANCIF